MRTSAGFTLLELLVAMAILGLVMAVTPSLLPIADRTSFVAVVRDLVSDLRSLRGQAIATHASVVFELAPVADSFQPMFGGEIHALPRGVTLIFDPADPSLVGVAPSGIAFFPDGSSSGGTLTVRQGFRVMVVQVHWLDGKISIGG
jgi:general secretion pathway protein H